MTRLKRCVSRGLRFIHGLKAIAQFEDRADRWAFFYKHEVLFREDIALAKIKRDKLNERIRKELAGEELSDTSSVKEKKKKMKD